MEFTKKELLDIFERFGQKAQQALDFVRKNAQEDYCIEPVKPLENGVYIVYKEGYYFKYSADLKKQEGMRVGICWDGHMWIVGKDYGELPWSECPESELEANEEGVMEEWQVAIDWDAFGLRKKLINLWRHIGFKTDETMPTAPMVLVQEHLAKYGELNDALRFCRMPRYEVGTYRWFAERCNVGNARLFSGTSGSLSYGVVCYRLRVQGVFKWKI